MMRRVVPVAAACLCGALGAIAQPRLQPHYSIDPARSHATIAVGKSGAFSFAAGHTHEVEVDRISGEITVDPAQIERSTVKVTIDAARLKVTAHHEPPDDVPKVQQTMDGPQVLDVGRYPQIAFESTSIQVKRRAADTIELVVAGRLTLRGSAHAVAAPVVLRLDGGALTATGRFPVKQTDFGIKPVSVGGVVSVKDVVNIDFTIVAR